MREKERGYKLLKSIWRPSERPREYKIAATCGNRALQLGADRANGLLQQQSNLEPNVATVRLLCGLLLSVEK